MMHLITYKLFESERRSMFLYHGVKNRGDVDAILRDGFDLDKIRPIWNNDLAISTMTSSDAISKFFGGKVPIIKIEFEGNISDIEDIGHLTSKDAEDYTGQIVELGVDAVRLGGSGARQVFIYNTDAIKKTTLI